MILEAVRLLQEGQLEQAEYLLLEGKRAKSKVIKHCAPYRVQYSSVNIMQVLRLCLHVCTKLFWMHPTSGSARHHPAALSAKFEGPGACAGLRYVEGALPDNAGVASLLDQLALVQFLLDRLPEAEASAQRMVELAAHMFAGDMAAQAMCSLRLGAVLAGEVLLQRSVMHRQSLSSEGSVYSMDTFGVSGSLLAVWWLCVKFRSGLKGRAREFVST